MYSILWIFVILCCGCNFVQSQHVPPGVPPKRYQQPPSPQYQNIPPHPSPHRQYNNGPPQQAANINPEINAQVPHVPYVPEPTGEHVPTHQIPADHSDHHEEMIFDTAHIVKEKEHIQEHVRQVDTSQMTNDELTFHYFTMMDSDKDNRLDGLEIVKYVTHSHEETDEDSHDRKIHSDQELIEIVDPLLEKFDVNNDGFLDYVEFKKLTSLQ